jgi:hypothetical protein
MRIFLLLLSSIIITQNFYSQTNCIGRMIFTEKKCVGDEISSQEKELYKIINDYRVANKLPPVAILEALSLVANRHLLDLTNNVKFFTHGWSDCPYDIKNEKTWNCVTEAPQRLKTNYQGQGYENLYRNLGGNATPQLALDAWKKSPLHNNLILNLDVWKDTSFDAFGLAISGNYAAIWFGTQSDKEIDIDRDSKGLGVTFNKLVSGLTNILSIQQESSVSESEKWIGKSADKSIVLEVYGQEKDIAETSMSLSVKLDKNSKLSPQSRAALSQFLKNLAEKWTDRETWTDATLLKFGESPNLIQTVNVSNKTIEVKINAGNYLNFLVRPRQTPKAKEL